MRILVAYLIKSFVDQVVLGLRLVGLLLAIMVLLLINLLTRHISFVWTNELGIAIRKGLTGLLFAKSLKMSLAAVNKATPSKLINLSSGDMALIETSMLWLPGILGYTTYTDIYVCV